MTATAAMTSDIDGGEAAETVSFALDGVNYEIDLSATNADALRGVFSDYTAQARRVSKGRGRGTGKAAGKRPAGSDGASAAEIRAWGRDHGFDVRARGRVTLFCEEPVNPIDS